jgi:threonine synthase
MKLELNPNILRLVCAHTREAFVPSDLGSRPIGRHGESPLLFEYDLGAISRQPVLPPFVAPSGPGLWRYGPLLPVSGVSERYAGDVGRTPVVCDERLLSEHGVELHLKLEGRNPSGSFKDRGLAVAVALAVACGARRLCLPTQGCAGVAAALFSARAGLPGPVVYMAEPARDGAYHRAAAAFGAEVRFAGASIGEAGERMRADLARELAEERWLDASTFFEPGRLEGKKTMGFEIVESFGPTRLPDVILYPTGGGTGLVGIWKAFDELAGLGVLARGARRPRMVAVQSERCAPVVRAFEGKLGRVEPVRSEGTVAEGLDVPAAVMGASMLAVLRESGGTAVAVREEAILAAHAALARHGLSAGYEGAAAVAALAPLCKRGDVKAGERVLCILTSSHLVSLAARAARGDA